MRPLDKDRSANVVCVLRRAGFRLVYLASPFSAGCILDNTDRRNVSSTIVPNSLREMNDDTSHALLCHLFLSKKEEVRNEK